MVTRDLTECHRLFPKAALTGDDWTWDRADHPPASVQEAVVDFAVAHNWTIQRSKNTWLLIGSGKTNGLRAASRRWWSSLFGASRAA